MALLPTIRSPHDLKRLPLSALPDLCGEIRQAICEQVSQSGGHLAPNLGVVELTVAMHYVFDFGHDRLLFDVGHQCYTHKLLTGRQALLPKLRQRGGMAGFPDPAESPYDLFMVGHAGTAISTAVGVARGDSLFGDGWAPENPAGRRVVSIIGDASIVNGVAMEGLNNCGTLRRQFLVVLNDNGMSIAPPQGAISRYFDRLRISRPYTDFKRAARDLASQVPGGEAATGLYHRLGESGKALLSHDAWFSHFGLVPVGPLDGHDLRVLTEYLTELRSFPRPALLHVKTVKGKGFDFAESDATSFHSPAAFTMERMEREGCRVEISSSGRSFTQVAGEALASLMERDPRVVACTAAMPDGTGLTKVLERFPDRAWDTGICESHAMDMMAGLAKTGARPFFAVYSTFLQRAFDQVFQEVSLQGLAVRLLLDRAGFVGGDGAVHHGFCDISLLAPLPGSTLMAAMDEPSLRAAIDFMSTHDAGLSAVRYPRDKVDGRLSHEPCPPFELGRARALRVSTSPDVAVLALGTMALTALDAASALADRLSVAVWDARYAKPLDGALLEDLLRRGIPVVTLEDHGATNGFGTLVLAEAHRRGLDTRLVSVLGAPESWIGQGSRAEQLAQVCLDTASVAAAIDRAAGLRRCVPG
ncbi:MAG: 1-deoxy-D-xylulose-5-phosphate synthase [Planctomycetota bacterium]|nr:1-deoxy-D-xylulose-5-phosphate synthase [Planctomycetota bacterium]MDA1106070.1 1-deoxy-D-xylulose-5-phosphate synthase [Planctomycetota bacterium]